MDAPHSQFLKRPQHGGAFADIDTVFWDIAASFSPTAGTALAQSGETFQLDWEEFPTADLSFPAFDPARSR